MQNYLKALGLGIALALAAGAHAQTAGNATTAKPAARATVPNPMIATEKEPSPAPDAKPMEVPKSPSRAVSRPAETAAPGGRDGKVWVNTASKTYHCPGSQYYGKTKAGEYMSEADARARGNRAVHNKACS